MKDELADLRKIDLPFDVDEVEPQCHECVRGGAGHSRRGLQPLSARQPVPDRPDRRRGRLQPWAWRSDADQPGQH